MPPAYLRVAQPQDFTQPSTGAPGCHGKVAFMTREHAVHAAARRKGREAYRCDACLHWHVGSSKKRTLFNPNAYFNPDSRRHLREAGRRKLADRILRRWPDDIEDLVRTCVGLTPTEFLERCVLRARQRRDEEGART